MLRKIGVFDSGIGGLTVLRQLRRAFPKLDMVYLGDVARVPYGGRGVETIHRYACDDVRFLLRHDVEAIVVACGTVSANSLDVLQEKFDLPIYGVIDSAVAKAAEISKTGTVGVIGTRATVASGAYERKLHSLRPDLKVVSQACPLIVPSVEAGVEPDDPLAGLVCDRYFKTFEGEEVDALIMGCTHYPVYRELFQQRLPKAAMLDVGETLAESLRETVGGEGGGSGKVEYYVTERSAAFNEIVRIMDESVDPDSIHVATEIVG